MLWLVVALLVATAALAWVVGRGRARPLAAGSGAPPVGAAGGDAPSPGTVDGLGEGDRSRAIDPAL
jgi:hypothetical protein